MTLFEPLTTPGTLGGPVVVAQEGSTSNLLLPKIVPALLPPFISIALLTGSALPPPHEALRSTQSTYLERTSSPTPHDLSIAEQVGDLLPTLARSVRSLRQRSGLTWDELATIFGVTRRTLYNWSIGGQLTSSHAQNLAKVIGLVNEMDAGEPRLTRSRLLAPAKDGSTLYARLCEQRRPSTLTHGDLSLRPDQLLNALFDTPDMTGNIISIEHTD